MVVKIGVFGEYVKIGVYGGCFGVFGGCFGDKNNIMYSYTRLWKWAILLICCVLCGEILVFWWFWQWFWLK